MSDANVGEGVVEITADTTKAEKEIAGLGGTINKKVGDDLVSFGKKGLLATGLLVGGLGAAGKAASDLGESINAVNVTYGANAEGILALGEKAATSVGLSSAAFNGLAVQFSAFATTIAGEGGNVVGTIEELTGRAADFASVMNIDVAEAARLFQSGLAGETEPLRKFGIDLSAAAVSAHALETGIIDTNRELTESEKVQSRYSLLMQQTAKTQGDFANTSDGAANAQRILTAEFTNMGAKIGAAVLPPLTSLVSGLSATVGWISDVNDATGGMIGKLAVAGTGLLAAASSISFVTGKAMQLRDKFTTLGADGSRSMTGLGKALGVAGAVAGVAMLVYGAYADEKARVRAITDEFVESLAAETAGQEGATDAAIARRLVDRDLIDLGAKMGISAREVAAIVRGEEVPAWTKLQEILDSSQYKMLANEQKVKALGDAFDTNGYKVHDFEQYVSELRDSMGTAQAETAELEAANRALGVGTEETVKATEDYYRKLHEGTKVVEETTTKTNVYARARAEAAYWEKQYAADVEAAQEAEERHAESLEVVREAQDAAREAVIHHIEAMNEQIETMRSAADATYAVRAATDDYTDFLQGLDEAVKTAGDDQEALNRIYRDGTGKAADLADATVKVYEETLKANGGTLTATARLDTFNQSMLTSAARASGPLRQGILDYLVQVNQIPADKVTALEMYVNAGLMDEAQRLIDETSAAREVAISADVNEASLDGVETLLGTLTRPRFVKINGEWVGAKFAEGTSSAPGGVALVGEDGPELVNIPAGSQVHTAEATRTLLAGPAPAPSTMEWPEEVTFVIEGQPMTGRIVAYDRARADRRRQGIRG